MLLFFSFSFSNGIGLDFTDTPLVINVGANKNEVEVPYFFTVIDDEIDEFEQSFALVAEIGQEVPDNISCFQVPGTVECFGRFGATEIIINDNDGRSHKVTILSYIVFKHRNGHRL